MLYLNDMSDDMYSHTGKYCLIHYSYEESLIWKSTFQNKSSALEWTRDVYLVGIMNGVICYE